MKKAFTLSESLVALALVAILAAILIPVIDGARPDKDKVTYKKALYNLQAAVSDAMDTAMSSAANVNSFWKDSEIDENEFCNSVAKALNTSGTINCGRSKSSYDNPNFITTDGIRYWNLEGKFSSDVKDIYVDRGLSSNERTAAYLAKKRGSGRTSPGLKIQVQFDGKIGTDITGSTSTYENDLIESGLNLTDKSQ